MTQTFGSKFGIRGLATGLALAFFLTVIVVVSAAVSPGTYFPSSDSFNGDFAPGSSHLSRGTPSCTVNADLSIDCSAFTLGGVGHTNADLVLSANYRFDFVCNNPAGGKNRNNEIEPHSANFTDSAAVNIPSSKNGQLSVPTISADMDDFSASCPNGNWELVGTPQLVSFSYTLTFDGFNSPYITIAQP